MTKIAPQAALPDSIAVVTQTPGSTGGHSFATLLAEVAGETNFRARARNSTTGAAGPYQFLKSTWLDLVRRHGKEVGIKAELVAQVTADAKGHPVVKDQKATTDLLALRHDPVVASKLAAKYLDEGKAALAQALKREPSEAEVHMAYLLGASGATQLIKAATATPDRPVGEVIGAAARSNKPLFQNGDGAERSAAESVAFLTRKYLSDKATASRYIAAASPEPARKVDA